MPKATDITILEAHCSFEPVQFRSPLKFGGRVMDRACLINVEVRIETRNRRQEAGFGSMPAAAVWAWPSSAVPVEKAEEAMKQFAGDVVELAVDYPDYAHPIDIAEQLAGEYDHLGKLVQQKLKLAEPLPVLAQLVAASPLDAEETRCLAC